MKMRGRRGEEESDADAPSVVNAKVGWRQLAKVGVWDGFSAFSTVVFSVFWVNLCLLAPFSCPWTAVVDLGEGEGARSERDVE